MNSFEHTWRLLRGFRILHGVAHGSTVERLIWEAGEPGAPVIFYRIHGGGHTWPGGTEHQPEDILGKICRDVNATALMWKFFQEHPLPEKP